MNQEKVVISIPEEEQFIPSFEAWGKKFDWTNKDVTFVHVFKKNVHMQIVGTREYPSDEEFLQLKPEFEKHVQSVANKIIPASFNKPFKVEILMSVSPAEAMVQYLTKEKTDSIVVASRKKTPLQEFYMNSFVDRLIQLAPCDIIVIRRR